MKKSPQILFHCESSSLAYFEEKFSNLEVQGVKSVMFLIASEYPHTSDSMNRFLRAMPVPVSGGVFPEIIHEGQYYKNAMMAILWFEETHVHTFQNASDLNSELYQQQEPIVEHVDYMTSIVFSNTKTRAAEAALDALYFRTGQRTQYAGAGSAYIAGIDSPSIVTNDGLVGDSIQISCLPYKQATRTGHGWSVLSGPHLVTESEQNRVRTLDYQAIKPYFQSLIQSNSDEDVSHLSFEQMLQHYPVGIQPYDEDIIVRDILGYEDGLMEFIGDIPEFSNIYILSGKQEDLLRYVQSDEGHFNAIADTNPDLSLIFSCVGRRAYMGDKSAEELTMLTQSLGSHNVVIGVSSVGEIASNNTGLARLHSMSLVVSSLWI